MSSFEYEVEFCIQAEKGCGVEIRLFTQQDAQTLWDLRMLALETDPWSFVDSPEELRRMSIEEFAERLKDNDAANFIYGAFEGGSAVGMVGFYQEVPMKRRHKGWIWGVFVAPAARGRGVARKLMQATIERSKSLPELDMILLTVSASQPIPRRLYESLGFRSFGIEPKGLKIGNEAKDEENMVLEFER
jgi:ribosomal protein S18 acetylase RimI-like enzyme